MHFHVYTKIIVIKVIVYIFITFRSFESWTIYVIYIVILIWFSLCKLESQKIKFCVRHFGQFLSNVNIDVNGNLPFLKFPLDFNCCVWETDICYLSKPYILGMHHLPFQSLQNISIFFTMLHNIKCLVNIKVHSSLCESIFVELLLASDCRFLIWIHILYGKQCRSRPVGFFRATWSGSTLIAKAGHIRVQQDKG